MQTTTVAGRTWSFSHAIGRRDTEARWFSCPTAVAVAGGGVLYVLSRGVETVWGVFGEKIEKLTIDEGKLGEFGGSGGVHGGGRFVWAAGLALDKHGNVYCSDEYRNLISIFDSAGQVVTEWGEAGHDRGQFRGPSGLAMDSEDNLYVVDCFNHRVQKFTVDGRALSCWGGSGSGPGELSSPWGITIDQGGDVYVADWGNNRVQKFSGDGKSLMSFGSDIAGAGDLNHPADVAVDSEGDVYITDWGNKRVQIFDPDGDFITSLHGDAYEFSKAAKEFLSTNPEIVQAYRRVEDLSPLARFERPRGIAVDEQDRIIITDSARCRLQVYVKEKDYIEPEFNV